MAVTLNKAALEHAKSLIRSGQVVRDERDRWSEDAPTPEAENAYLDAHGADEYGEWHLGIDRSEADGTKARYSFPFGDFTKVHRCGVISLEGRAAQYGHTSIAKAAKDLLDYIDRGE